MNRPHSFGSGIERGSLALLALFTAASVAGYGYYALHPENLPASGFALRIYSLSFGLFAQLHILLCFLALATLLVLRMGARWIPALAAVYVLSFTAEHVGTGWGIPFGGYEYTGLLGSRLGPRVPLLIPLSWFLMALPAWVLAGAALPGRPVARLPLGALGLVLWDLALDPAMSFLTPYWRWAHTGPYYGMPWLNLAGWFATGLALMAALRWAMRPVDEALLPLGWLATYYALVVALPIGMLAAAGAWGAVLATGAAYAGTATAVHGIRAARGSRRAPDQSDLGVSVAS